MMCGWLSGAGCASTRRCDKALLQAAPRVRKRDDARRIVRDTALAPHPCTHAPRFLLRGSSLSPQLPAPLDLHPYRDAVTVTVAPTLTLARTLTLTLARTRTRTLARTRTRTLARTHNPNPYPNPNPNPRWFVLHPDK